MKKGVLFLICFCNLCYAALPPRAQNERDLDVLIGFIKSHELVMETVELIDFEHYTIFYRKGCKVIFEREAVIRPKGWVGPEAPLKYQGATCEIDY